MSAKVAVFQFPGSNCEYETMESLNSVGLEADIVSWSASESELDSYSAYVLPGGFSFQDRVRAGVVSSKLPLIKHLIRFADEGKPILGICNGCQILAETGLVPNSANSHNIEMALAPNMKHNDFYGFVCDWVYVKIDNPKKNIFTTAFSDNEVIPIQINHGEGNFRFSNPEKIQESTTTQIKYCDESGQVTDDVNPNGAMMNIAGLSNSKGNVLAMMPHPERATFNYQVPRYLNHEAAETKRNAPSISEGPWQKLFLSLANHLKGQH